MGLITNLIRIVEIFYARLPEGEELSGGDL
jgi:hypothetical protein